jgi:hypothetical protein
MSNRLQMEHYFRLGCANPIGRTLNFENPSTTETGQKSGDTVQALTVQA